MSTDNTCDLYSVLGLSRHATQDDIKRSYKKLALQHHPDKKGGDDIEFKRLNEAYQILSDPDKKKMYDVKYEDNVNIDLLNKFASVLMNIVHEKLKEKVAQNKNSNKNASGSDTKDKEVSVPPIILKMTVDVEDIYYGRVKKIVVKVKRKTIDGFVFKSIPLYISLLNYEDKYTFRNQGDEDELHETVRGDIIVNIKIVSEKQTNIQIDTLFCKYDLHIEYKMSLYEYLYGLNVSISFYNETINVINEPFERTNMLEDGYYNYVHEVTGKGLPYIANKDDNNINDEENTNVKRGKLYIYFKLSINRVPRDVLLEHREIFKRYFNTIIEPITDEKE
jgi:DnaJ-class molecular chaperone